MAKSDKHAESSAKQYGGSLEDYLEIHEMMDSSKSSHADNRHRVIFHSAFGAYLIQKMFGMDFDKMKQLQHKYQLPDEFLDELVELFKHNRQNGVHWKNGDGKKVHVRDIAEQHILEDFRMRFIPSLSDYLQNMSLKGWMNNGIGENLTNQDQVSKTKKAKQINFVIKQTKD